jgi:hypothetical protein
MAKVRIRKAGPGETPGYYNKTAMYLRKAQEGIEVDSGEDQGTAQEKMLETYQLYAYQQLANEVAPDKVYSELVENGLPDEIAYKIVTVLIEKLVDEGQLNPDYKREKQAEAPEESQQEGQQAQGQPAQVIEEDWNENYGPNANAQQQEDQSVYDEDQDLMDMEEDYLQDRSYMQDGGEAEVMDQYDTVKNNDVEKFDLERLINETPGIQQSVNFPGLNDYIPDYQELQWNNIDALQPTQTDQNLSPQLESQKVGGMIKKKQFVKNVMSLLKKQDGGDNAEQAQQEEQKDPTLGKGNRMDTLTEDVKKHKDNFLSAVKEKATTVKTEEMYDKLKQSNDPSLQQMGMQSQQQFQTGGMTGGQDPLFRFIGGGQEMQEDPGYYEADFLPEAKLGLDWKDMKYIKDATAYYKNKSNTPTSNTVNKPTVRNATLRYVPNYITNPGGFMRTLTPWNPLLRTYRYNQQVGNPYIYGTNTPYLDPLRGMTPIARQVTKRGIFGRPKRYTDIYAIPGTGGKQTSGNIIADGNTLIFPSNKQAFTNLPLLDNPHGNKPREKTYKKSNLEGLSFGAKNDVRHGEAKTARQLRRGQEQFPEDSNYQALSDQEELAKFQHQRRQQGKTWDEEKQAWVDTPDLKMDIKKPTKISGTPEIEKKKLEQEEKRIKEKLAADNHGRPVGNVTYETRNRRISPSKEKLEELYNRDVMQEAYGGMVPSYEYAYGGYLPAAQDGLEFTVTDAQGNAISPADNYMPPQPPTKPDLSNWDSMGPSEKFHAIRTMSTTPQMFTQEELDKYMLNQPTEDEMQMMNQEVPTEPLMIPQQRYGGLLKANNGLTINNPNLPQPAPANPDLAVGNNPGLIGQVTQGPNSFWSQQQSFNTPAPVNTAAQTYNSDPANNMAMEPVGDDLSNCTDEQIKDPTSKCYKANQTTYVGVDVKEKKKRSFDGEAAVNVFNAGVRGVTGLLNRGEEKRRERQMYDNLTGDNLYASQGTKHRGDWVDLGSQMGQYRFDQMGQDRSGFSSYGKYGGYMQNGGERSYAEGDEVYMTEDDLKDFLKKGGQVEYL